MAYSFELKHARNELCDANDPTNPTMPDDPPAGAGADGGAVGGNQEAAG